MSTEDLQHYRLIYEGLIDDSPSGLQKLRATLISDLELSVEQAKQIMLETPATVKTAASQDELALFYQLLKKAGAKVLIVDPQGAALDSPAATESSKGITTIMELDQELSASSAPDQKESKTDDVVDEITFEFDDTTVPAEPKPKETKVHHLDLDDNAPLFSLGNEEPADETPVVGSPLDQLLVDLNAENNSDQAPTPTLNLSVETPTTTVIETPTPSKPVQIESSLDLAPEMPAESSLDLEEEDEIDLVPAAETEVPETAGPPSATSLQMAAEASLDSAFAMEDTPNLDEPSPPPKPAQVQNSGMSAKPVPTSARHSDEIVIVPRLPRRKRRRFLPLDIILPASAGIILLGIGNWLFFSAQDSGLSGEEVDKLLADTQSAMTTEPVRAPSQVKLTVLSDFKEAPTHTISYKFPTDGVNLVAGSIRITTQQPPELTPLEIVQNKAREPWLAELAISNLSFPRTVDGSFTLESPARAFVEYQGQRKRLIGQAKIKGNFNPEKSLVSLQVEVAHNIESAPKEDFIFTATENGRYKFFIRANIDATKPPSS